MRIPAAVARLVEARAGPRCEYCRMDAELQGATFHVEHIVPRARGGSSDPENLAWACPACNLRKSHRITATDPRTGDPAPLYHPRTDRWDEHFAWVGFELVGLTPSGRATVAGLALNDAKRLRVREAEESIGLFPPRISDDG